MDRQPQYLSILSTIAQLKRYKSNILNAGYNRAVNKDNALYLNELLKLPASETSLFSDTEWDFNIENPNVSPSIRGSKLRINFAKYKNVPTEVTIEIKCILLAVLLTPEVFINNRKKAKKKDNLQTCSKYSFGTHEVRAAVPRNSLSTPKN